jgi:hypothetical protein
MADYSIASQIQPFQAPNLLALAAQGQQMQTNALKAQLLQQEASREAQLRQLYATPGFDMTSPESIRKMGLVGGPDVAFKGLTAARQAENLQRQTQVSMAELALKNRDLITKQGEGFQNSLRMVDAYPEAQRPGIYKALIAQLPEELRTVFPGEYTPDAVSRGMRTTAQLIADAAPKAPVRGKIGDVDVVYDPENPTLARETVLIPAGASYPMRPGAAADMAQRGQKYAPELMQGGTPVTGNAMAPAAAPSPYGGLNAMAAPQAGGAISASQLVAQQKERTAMEKLQAVGQETLARERAQAVVKTEEQQRTEQLAKEKVTGTLKGIVDAYKSLASRGELIRAAGDQGAVERAGIGVKAALPSALTTVISPKTGADISTIENLRRDLIPTITALTGAKSIDAVAELTSVLNSLSSPGQTDTAIVRTLNNFGEKYGLGKLLSLEDLTPAKSEKPSEIPAERKPATPARALSDMDKQALDWAKSNPNDPRASAIKERLGVR